ncbi:POK11 protein, partial [Alaudala cheleensis]|nr:POK11 protein [Alaudala cheleensis]
LAAAGFELQQEKVQRLPPWRYLGSEIANRRITPQKLAICDRPRILRDLHQLCGSLNWVRPWLGLTTEDLARFFNLLKRGEELDSPRALTQAAQQTPEKVQLALLSRQAHYFPLNFVILGKLPHLHGLIFQWDKDQKDPFLITEWVFLDHQLSKSITKPQELMGQLISKARVRKRLLAGCEFTCIHVPIKLSTGKLTNETLEQLLPENEMLQFTLDGYPGKISIHCPGHKLFNSEFNLIPKEKQSCRPLKALTIFTDAS